MAYGLKYRLKGKARVSGEVYKVLIYKQDYSGAVLERNVPANPFTLRRDSAEVICGTSLEFAIRAEQDFEFIDLYSEDSKAHKVELLDGADTVIWTGFVLTEKYQEAYRPAPVTVKFTATDGLGLLKNEDYTPDGTRKSALAILNECLSSLSLGLGWSHCLKIWATSMDTTRSPLTQVHHNTAVFAGLSKYKVIEQLLRRYDAILTQADGRWAVQRYADIGSTCVQLTAAGTYEATVPSTPILQLGAVGADVYPIGELDMYIRPTVGKAKLSLDYGTQQNILPSFGDGWIQHYSGGNESNVPNVESVKIGASSGSYTDSYVKVDFGNVEASTLDVQLFFRYGLDCSDHSHDYVGHRATVVVKLVGSAQTYYLSKTGWTTAYSELRTDKVTASHSQFQWYDYALKADGFPVGGALEVRLLADSREEYAVIYAKYKEVSISFLDDDNALSGGLQLTAALTKADASGSVTVDISGGDVPIHANNKLVYKAYTSLSNGSVAEAWHTLQDATPRTLVSHLLAAMASRYRTAPQVLTGNLRASRSLHNVRIAHAYNSGRQFVVEQMSWAVCEDMSSVTMVEVLPWLTSATWQLVSEDATTPDSSRSGSSAPVIVPTVAASWANLGDRPFATIDSDDLEVTDEALGLSASIKEDIAAGKDGAFENYIDEEGRVWGDKDHSEAVSVEASDEAGNAAKLDNVSAANYMRKDVEQTAAELITFAKGLTAQAEALLTKGAQLGLNGEKYLETLNNYIALYKSIGSETFTSGLAGTGTRLDMANSHLELDKLTVRQQMLVRELIIQKVKAVGGELILSPGAMKITSVVSGGTYYTCYFDNDDGNIVQPFSVGSQVRCQTFTGTNLKYYWARVSSVGDDWFNISASDKDGSGIPEAGDEVVECGHRTDTARQSVIVLSAYGTDAPYQAMYDGVDGFSFVGKEINRMGDLSGVTSAVFGQLSGTGTIIKKLYAEQAEISGHINVTGGNAAKLSDVESVSDEATAATNAAAAALAEAEAAAVAVDAIEVGGVNLLADSNFKVGMTATNSAWDRLPTVYDDDTYAYVKNKFDYNTKFYVIIEPGTYTFSVLAKNDAAGMSARLRFYGDNLSMQTVASVTDDWVRYSLTFEIDTGGVQWFHIIGDNTYNPDNYFRIAQPQIEQGNKATAWSPSPEDVETARDAAIQAAQDLYDITIKAYADGIVSDEEARAIADAQAKADAAEAAAKAASDTLGSAAAAQAAAETYALAKANLAETTANAYADGIVTAEETRAIADATAKADAAEAAAKAASDTLGSAAAAQTAAQTYALAQANLAKTNADAYADGIVSDEEARAIQDATDKAEAARIAAEAASDVVGSAAAAQAAAEATAVALTDAIEVGGVNLLADSNFKVGMTATNSAWDRLPTVYDDDTYAYVKNKFDYNTKFYIIIEPGTYTFSVLAKNDAAGMSARLRFYGDNLSIQTVASVTDDWVRYSLTFEIDTGGEQWFHIIGDNTYNPDNYFRIAQPQIEKGNKATAWSPSPEDVEANAQAAQTAAETYALAKANLAETTAKAYADDEVSAEEARAIADAQAKADAAKTAAESTAATLATAAENAAKSASDPVGSAAAAENAAKAASDPVGSAAAAEAAAKADADAKVAALEYVGENLMDNTEAERVYNGSSYYTDYASVPVVPGGTYTLQVEGYIDAAAQAAGCSMRINNSTMSNLLIMSNTSYLQRTTTIVIPDGMTTFDLRVGHYPSGTTTGNMYLRKVKFERGDRATAWSASPKDLVNDAKGEMATLLGTDIAGLEQMISDGLPLIQNSKINPNSIETPALLAKFVGAYLIKAANIDVGNLVANFIGANKITANNIDVGNLLVKMLQTSTSDGRIEIDDATNEARVFDDDGVRRLTMSPYPIVDAGYVRGVAEKYVAFDQTVSETKTSSTTTTKSLASFTLSDTSSEYIIEIPKFFCDAVIFEKYGASTTQELSFNYKVYRNGTLVQTLIALDNGGGLPTPSVRMTGYDDGVILVNGKNAYAYVYGGSIEIKLEIGYTLSSGYIEVKTLQCKGTLQPSKLVEQVEIGIDGVNIFESSTKYTNIKAGNIESRSGSNGFRVLDGVPQKTTNGGVTWSNM